MSSNWLFFFHSYTGTCDVLGVFTGMERKRLKKMNHHGLKKIATRFTIVSDPNDGIAWKIYQNSKWVFEHPEKNSLYKKTINQFFEWDTITNESNCFSKFFVFCVNNLFLDQSVNIILAFKFNLLCLVHKNVGTWQDIHKHDKNFCI